MRSAGGSEGARGSTYIHFIQILGGEHDLIKKIAPGVHKKQEHQKQQQKEQRRKLEAERKAEAERLSQLDVLGW